MSKLASGRDDPRFRDINSMQDYMGQDLARTHGFTCNEAAAGLDPDMVDAQHAQLLRDGYIIIEKLIPEDVLDTLRAASRRRRSARGGSCSSAT